MLREKAEKYSLIEGTVKLEAEQLYGYDKFCITGTKYPAEGAQVFHFIPESLKYFVKQIHRPQSKQIQIFFRIVDFSLILQNSLQF